MVEKKLIVVAEREKEIELSEDYEYISFSEFFNIITKGEKTKRYVELCEDTLNISEKDLFDKIPNLNYVAHNMLLVKIRLDYYQDRVKELEAENKKLKEQIKDSQKV